MRTRQSRPVHAHGPAITALTALLLPSFLLVIGGCASSERPAVTTEIKAFTAEERAAWEGAQEAKYRLQAGDELRLLFKYHSELNQDDITVMPDGRITAPGIEAVRAAGLTVDELVDNMTAIYGREYLDPDMSVIVESFGLFGVYVFGEVRRPGMAMLPPSGSQILQIIAQSGGFTEDASAGEVLHVRVTPEGYEYRHLDLTHLEQRDFMALDMMDLRPYDVIYVPRSGAGDFRNFSRQILGSALNITDLFWDIYAIANLNKVDRLVR